MIQNWLLHQTSAESTSLQGDRNDLQISRVDLYHADKMTLQLEAWQTVA